jgi:CheY-like chemotaxis protein
MDTECEAIPNGKVLVVDNKDMSLYIARGMLSLYGLLIDTAKSGHEAIEKIKYNVYDLVLMDHDHMMPGMDGMKTTREVRKLKGEYEKLPIFALTVNTAAGMKEMFLANGFNGYISKPIVLQDMDKTLKGWLSPEKISRRARAASAVIDSEAYNEFVEGIKKIKEINTEIAINRFSGSKKIYYKVVNMFNKNLLPECNKMAAFLNSRDIAGFTIPIYGMKSSLATIGAIELSKMAMELGIASKNREIDYCLERFPEFMEKLLLLRERLCVIFPEAEALKEREPELAAEVKGMASTMRGSPPEDTEQLRENTEKALTAA